MTNEATQIAQWFLHRKEDFPFRKYDGFKRLQKLMYFSWVFHYAKYNKILFTDAIQITPNSIQIFNYEAYQHLPVDSSYSVTSDIEKILLMVADLFKYYRANEFTTYLMEDLLWSETKKGTEIISVDVLQDQNKLDHYQMILHRYEGRKRVLDVEIVNEFVFLYDKNELTLTEDVLAELENFNGEERVYNVYMDESQGLVIY